MAKTMKCKTCGEQISKKAKQCPHCGHDYSKKSGGMSIMTAAIAIGLTCESFYRKGGYSRLFYLRENCWVEGHCDDIPAKSE